MSHGCSRQCFGNTGKKDLEKSGGEIRDETHHVSKQLLPNDLATNDGSVSECRSEFIHPTG